jgi:hypothetical protein
MELLPGPQQYLLVVQISVPPSQKPWIGTGRHPQKAYEHVQAETPMGSFYLALAVKQYLLVLQISVPPGQKAMDRYLGRTCSKGI